MNSEFENLPLFIMDDNPEIDKNERKERCKYCGRTKEDVENYGHSRKCESRKL